MKNTFVTVTTQTPGPSGTGSTVCTSYVKTPIGPARRSSAPEWVGDIEKPCGVASLLTSVSVPGPRRILTGYMPTIGEWCKNLTSAVHDDDRHG